MVVHLSPESASLIADEIYKRMQPIDENDILGVADLAKLLKVEDSWVYQKVKQLPHFRVGKHVRFIKWEVLAALRGKYPSANAV